MTKSASVLALALLCGCSTNPVTGRDQIVELPAVQAHADIGFALSSGAQRLSESEPCDAACRQQDLNFDAQVKRLGAGLEAAVRSMSPDLFERIGSFQIEIDPELGTSTGSSAGGRIVLGGGIARLEPADDVTAFLMAREMAHVIARHDEEDSGARMIFSALSALMPYTLIVRLLASTVGSSALTGSWAEQQRREADEIAITLLVRTGRSVAGVGKSLATGLKRDRLPEGEWTARYIESAERVAAAAESAPKYADFEDWLGRESVQSIERIAACIAQGSAGRSEAQMLARRRECMGGAA